MATIPTTDSDAEVVAVRVNGRIYEHWDSVSITRSMTAAAAAFSFVAPWWLPKPGEALLARPGDAVTIEIGGVPVIVGYIDEIGPGSDADKVAVQIAGRSKAGDIVDCDAIVKGMQLKGLDLLGVAKTLCKPFGVGVAVDSGVKIGAKFPLVEIEQGETVHQVLVRLARERGLLLWSTSDGGVIFGRGARGRAQTALIHRVGSNGEPVDGNTVLSISGKFSVANRFSELVVKGQSKWDLDAPAITSAQPRGRALDAGVLRYRPKVLNAENAATSASMAARAQWDVARRIAAGTQISASLAGWRQTPDGDLWDVGLLTRVVDDVLNLDGDYLVSAVGFRAESAGLRADLTLEPPEAHAPEPVQPKGAGGGQWASIHKQTHE